MPGILIALVGLWGLALSALDVRYRLLPNWLTMGGAVVALGAWTGARGWAGLIEGCAAGAVAGAFMLMPFLMRGAGSGDVKMLFAAGVMAGWSRVLLLLWCVSLAGLALASIMLTLRQLDASRLKHYARCAVDWRYDRRAGAALLPPADSAKVRVPFGIAITVGLLFALCTRLYTK